jgi:hypothetical protein
MRVVFQPLGQDIHAPIRAEQIGAEVGENRRFIGAPDDLEQPELKSGCESRNANAGTHQKLPRQRSVQRVRRAVNGITFRRATSDPAASC